MSLLLCRKLRLYSAKVLDGDQLLGFLAFNLSTNGILHKQNFYSTTDNLPPNDHQPAWQNPPRPLSRSLQKKRNRPIPPSLQNADRSFSRELPALSYFLSAACVCTTCQRGSISIHFCFFPRSKRGTKYSFNNFTIIASLQRKDKHVIAGRTCTRKCY